jgi:hypothetical protein
MSSMNSRLKGLGFGSKRKSSANNVPTVIAAQNPSASSPQLAGRPDTATTTASSSTTSLPMNHPGSGGRPPSYTNNYAPAPAGVGRTTSPMATGNPRTPPTQMMGGPPPINTAASGYPPGHPGAGGMGAPPVAGGPPQYGPPQYGAPGAPAGGSIAAAQYANRNNAVEVEGAGRSKAQLIVGIDFVRHSMLSIDCYLTSIGNYLLRCCLCLCDEHRSQRRYHYRVAWCWILHKAKGDCGKSEMRNNC